MFEWRARIEGTVTGKHDGQVQLFGHHFTAPGSRAMLGLPVLRGTTNVEPGSAPCMSHLKSMIDNALVILHKEAVGRMGW